MKKKKVSGAHPESPLQQARIKAGLTQEYVAEILDCGTRSVQGYEAGRCDPPLAKLRKMMSLYECEFVSFCDRCGQHLDWKDYRKAKLIYPGRK